jgi:hypothetical protein
VSPQREQLINPDDDEVHLANITLALKFDPQNESNADLDEGPIEAADRQYFGTAAFTGPDSHHDTYGSRIESAKHASCADIEESEAPIQMT